MKPIVNLLLVAVVTLPVFAEVAWSQDDDEESRRCLSLRRIDYTEIIDDRTIAFFMRGSDVYINDLDRPCNGLEREGRFSYRTSLSQLCSADTISVLENTGFGFREGFSCGLGLFRPATRDLVETLKNLESESEEDAGIEVEDIEVEEDEDEE